MKKNGFCFCPSDDDGFDGWLCYRTKSANTGAKDVYCYFALKDKVWPLLVSEVGSELPGPGH